MRGICLISNIQNGDATDISIAKAKSSNSPTLDSSCVKTIKKTANYGPLPAAGKEHLVGKLFL